MNGRNAAFTRQPSFEIFCRLKPAFDAGSVPGIWIAHFTASQIKKESPIFTAARLHSAFGFRISFGFRPSGFRTCVCARSGDMSLLPACQNRFEVGRLFLSRNDTNFDLLESGVFEPSMKVALGKSQPMVAI